MIPTGFMAAISKGQEGGELTEMAELAACRRRRVHRRRAAGGLRRAAAARAPVQRASTGRPLALHCEDPDLSRGGHAHEGTVAAELGLGGYPSVAESVMVERDLALAEFEARPLHVMHMSARESVAALRAAQAAGVRGDGRGDAAPPVPHGRGAALARSQREDEPAAALRGRSPSARGGAPRRHDRGGRNRSRAARAPREGGAVRGGAVRRDGPRDGVLGALHLPRRARASSRWRRSSSACPQGRRARSGCQSLESRSARERISSSSTSTPSGWSTRSRSARARGTRGSSDRRSRGASSAPSPTGGRCSRGVSQPAISCSRTERSSAGSRSRPTASRSARPCSRRR